VFDTVGALGFADARRVLTRQGRFVPLNFRGREMLQALLAPLRGGQRMAIHVSGDSKADLQIVADMVAAGSLRPVVDRVFALSEIVEAHRYVEARHRSGAVIVDVAGGEPAA
jgi:NADPH:quinone reductase-like Zn-dependent oxidoreductase